MREIRMYDFMNTVLKFSIFFLELEVYIQDRIQKLKSKNSTGFFWLIEQYISGTNCPIKSNKNNSVYHIYQPLRSDRIWHKVNF